MSERFLGYILERKQNNALIKIVAKEKDGIFIKLMDEQQREYCPPRGEVFAPNFFADEFADKNKDCWEASFVAFSIEPAGSIEEQNVSHPDYTDYIIDYTFFPKQVSLTLLLPCPQVSGILRDGYCNPAEIKTVIDTEIFENQSSTFFVYDKTQVGEQYFKEELKSLRDDFVFWLQALKKIKIAYGNKDILASYRVFASSTTGNKKKVIKPQFMVYYKVEKLGLIKSLYYLSCWAINGFLKYRK